MEHFNFKLSLLLSLFLFLTTSCSKEESDSSNDSFSTPELTYSVSISSSEGGTVNIQSGTHNAGTVLNLKATPNDGYEFVGWTGSNESSSELSVTVNSNLELVANFQLIEISFNPRH